MPKEKMNELYNASKKIVTIILTLEMTNYNGYTLKFTSQEIFLCLATHPHIPNIETIMEVILFSPKFSIIFGT